MLAQADFVMQVSDTDQNGAFSCPKCKSLINPDDESGKNYVIIKTKVSKAETLVSLTFECKKCKATIRMSGFPKYEKQLLQHLMQKVGRRT